MATRDSTPDEIWQEVKEVISPIGKACETLEKNALGTSKGREQAGAVKKCVEELTETGTSIAQEFLAKNTYNPTGPRMGGSNSGNSSSSYDK